MDISKEETPHAVIWKVTQDGYSHDLLQKEVSLRKRRILIMRDQSVEIEEEGGPEKTNVALMRQAQKQVWELLWTVTRTRPDLMYAVAVLRNLPEGH